MSNEIVGTIQTHQITGELSYQTNMPGSSDYNDLLNKPSINGVLLKGDKTLDELNIASKEYVEQELATFDFIKIVQELPETGLNNRTYLVTKENQTENDLYDEYVWINKGTDEEPNWGWEYLGTKKIEVDLTEYVKKTDYSSNTNAGVAKTGIHGIKTDADGYLGIIKCTEGEIDKRLNSYMPIVAGNLDYAVKKSLSDNKLSGTSKAWTTDEKTSARALINAVGKTDYATYTNYGIIKVKSGACLKVPNGELSVVSATQNTVDNRATSMPEVIDTKILDYATKKAITASNVEWSEEEKANARNLIGVTEIVGNIETLLGGI